MKIKELLTDESKWCRKHAALNKYKQPVLPQDENAERWCLMGAIHKCYGDNTDDIRYKIEEHLNDVIEFWNDAPGRKFSDIKKLVDELDA